MTGKSESKSEAFLGSATEGSTAIAGASASNQIVTDKHFADWESHVFGFGYGTGEEHTLLALKSFFAAVSGEENSGYRSYDHRELEAALTPTVAWLLINILCRADVLDYGTSPRFGWLNQKGALLREYLALKSVEDLYEIVMRDDNSECYPDYCNCVTPCNNPLFAR